MRIDSLFDHMEPEPKPKPKQEAFARRTDPETSHASARKLDVSRVEKQMASALGAHGPGSSEDVTDWTGLPLVTVSPRLKPMERKGVVYRKGKKVNRSGRTAIVWALSSSGDARQSGD